MYIPDVSGKKLTFHVQRSKIHSVECVEKIKKSKFLNVTELLLKTIRYYKTQLHSWRIPFYL